MQLRSRQFVLADMLFNGYSSHRISLAVRDTWRESLASSPGTPGEGWGGGEALPPKPFRILSIAFALLLILTPFASALEPDQLLLLVNRNAPQGKMLAQFYAQQRHLPDGRIVEIPMILGDEIAFDAYERDVVPAVRDFLREHKLEDKVTCIVTFFGVPLRIGQKRVLPREQDEIAQLKEQQTALKQQIAAKLGELETEAKAIARGYVPPTGDEPAQLLRRAAVAIDILTRHATAAKTRPADSSAKTATIVEATKFFFGPAGVVRAIGEDPAQKAEMDKLREKIAAMKAEIEKLQESRYDPAARARMRQLIGDGFGALELLQILHAHQEYLQSPNSVAAFDSELASLWWNFYSRERWQPNLLFYGVSPIVRVRAPKTLMTCRLDAPQAGQVRDIIVASIKAEKEGLKGQLVLDSRGIAAKPDEPLGSYAWYDQSIRDLATLAHAHTKLQILHDESPTVLPPNSAQNVALYCGWYSVGNYVPACKFNLGAVGFHVASFELTSLRDKNTRQWVRNLINDGVVATLGPVAEPYLHAFPRADDFFALLLTGKLTVAEVYWRTQPLTSWMMALIADPLYTPYKSNPMLQLQDLPPRLAGVFAPSPTTQPAGR